MAWNSIFPVCRSRKTGRFARKGKCKAYRRSKVRRRPRNKKGQFILL